MQMGGASHANTNSAANSKPNFFVFQNKMNSRPSLHASNNNPAQTINGFGNVPNRTARNGNGGSQTNKYQLVGSTPVSNSAINVQ